MHEATAWLAAIVESSKDAIITKTLEGVITSWNGGAEHLFGYTAAEAVGRPVTMLMPQDRVAEEPRILERLRSGERVEHFETVRRHKSGALLDISLTISPIRDAEGRIVGVSKIARDITGRKRIEREVERQRRLYEGVLSTTLDLAYIFDRGHRFIYANESLLRVLGKTREQTIGKTCLEVGYEPWHSEMHGREIEQVFATKKPIRGVVPFTGATGRRVHDYIFTPVLDASGEVQAVAGTTRDVTELKEAEEARRASEERLARELAGMTRLHELSQRLGERDRVDQIMRQVMDAVSALVRGDRCTAQLVEQGEQGSALRLVAYSGFDSGMAERFSRVTVGDVSTCASTLKSHARTIASDLQTDRRFGELNRVLGPAGVRSAMSTPLLDSGGTLLGVFSVYWNRPHHPDEHELRLLELYVQQAARQIERRSSERALRESQEQLALQVADLEALRRLSLRVAAAGDRTTALNDVLDTAIPLVGASKGNVQLFDPQDGVLRIIASRGFGPDFLDEFREVPMGYSCCGAAMERSQRVIIEDAFSDPEFSALAPVYERYGFRAVQSTPLFTRDGRLLGMFSTHFAGVYRPSERNLRLLDQIAQHAGRVVERAQAEEELRRHRDSLQELVDARTREILEAQERVRLSERMASLGTLSAGLGHDMGNLLVPVRVHLETLSALDLPETAQEELAGIRSSVEYLRRLAGALRQLAIDPARAMKGETTELRGWWAEAETVLKNTLPRGVRLVSDCPAREHWVAMPKAALTQAVFNLVQNAGYALSEAGRGTVTLEIEPREDEVLVRVSDDGPGMDDEVKRRCMEPFYTTKTRGVSTGLGLALVYGLVQEAGGTIDLESSPGNGTRFTLHLPRGGQAGEGRTPGRMALVEMDDARFRAIVTAELQSLSYSVEFDPEAGERADIVVTDRAARAMWNGARVVVLGNESGAPAGAVALGARPRVEVIRDTLRKVAEELQGRISP